MVWTSVEDLAPLGFKPRTIQCFQDKTGLMTTKYSPVTEVGALIIYDNNP